MNLLFSSLTIGIIIAATIFLLAFVPTSYCVLPTGITSAVGTLVTFVTAWGFFVDFHTIFVCLVIYFGVEVAVSIFKGIMWLVRTVTKST